MRLLIFLLIICTATASQSQVRQISVSKQIPLIQQLCRAFEKDGRNEVIVKILDENPVKDPSCFACRSLFSVFETACKTKLKPKKKKEGEATPTIPKQRDPHPDVMRISALIVESFVKDEKNLSQYKLAMEKITLLLAGSYPDRAPAEIEYFKTFRDFIMQAFPEIKQSDEEAEAPPHPTVDVGALFEE